MLALEHTYQHVFQICDLGRAPRMPAHVKFLCKRTGAFISARAQKGGTVCVAAAAAVASLPVRPGFLYAWLPAGLMLCVCRSILAPQVLAREKFLGKCAGAFICARALKIGTVCIAAATAAASMPARPGWLAHCPADAVCSWLSVQLSGCLLAGPVARMFGLTPSLASGWSDHLRACRGCLGCSLAASTQVRRHGCLSCCLAACWAGWQSCLLARLPWPQLQSIWFAWASA